MPENTVKPCECAVAGFCIRHRDTKTQRDFELCKGINCDQKTSEKYRGLWDRLAKSNNNIAMAVSGNLQPTDARPVIRHEPGRNTFLGCFTSKCIFLGNKVSDEPCTCGSSVKIGVYKCNHPDTKLNWCVNTQTDKTKIRQHDIKDLIMSCDRCPHKTMVPKFITTAKFTNDVKRLVSSLPPDIDAVVGVARSGLFAATLVSMMLHKPMWIIRQTKRDVIYGGNGWRMGDIEESKYKDMKCVIVDDTVMTGNSLRAIKKTVSEHFTKSVTATVYVNPLSSERPDFYTEDLPWPHLLEWNLFNSVLNPSMVLDFDGILCHDCNPKDDDDGPRYAKWMREVKPLYHFRRSPIPMIVTARLEKYREPTLAWLSKWGMSTQNLVMGPWANNAERAKSDIAAFKAKHYKMFVESHRRSIKPYLFVESDVNQAERIARMSGNITICPAAAKCFLF